MLKTVCAYCGVGCKFDIDAWANFVNARETPLVEPVSRIENIL